MSKKNSPMEIKHNQVQVTPEHTDDISFAQDNMHRAMKHEEKMSQDAVSRSYLKTIRTVSIVLLFFLIIGFVVWWVVRPEQVQNDIETEVHMLINNGEFEKARLEVEKLHSRGDHTWRDSINNLWEIRRLKKEIADEEEKWNQKNAIIVGKSARSIVGSDYKTVQSELVDRGFQKKNIVLRSIERNELGRKFKKAESGSVTDISIAGDSKFSAKDKFRPDAIIEINYVK